MRLRVISNKSIRVDWLCTHGHDGMANFRYSCASAMWSMRSAHTLTTWLRVSSEVCHLLLEAAIWHQAWSFWRARLPCAHIWFMKQLAAPHFCPSILHLLIIELFYTSKAIWPGKCKRRISLHLSFMAAVTATSSAVATSGRQAQPKNAGDIKVPGQRLQGNHICCISSSSYCSKSWTSHARIVSGSVTHGVRCIISE